MKKLTFVLTAFCMLSACTTTEYVEVEKKCPSCVPPVRQLQVVTECSDFQETSLNATTYAQCRYCTNKFYLNGVDVTKQITGISRKNNFKKKSCKK